MKKRFINENKMLFRFTDLILVHCPGCNQLAKIIVPPNKQNENEPFYDVWDRLTRRVICTHCGYMKETKPKRGPFSDWKFEYQEVNIRWEAVDWFFGLPLYLQTPFRGQTFWAFNFAHLDYIERYIEAELRDPAPYYLSIESTLPRWIKSGKNRNELLKTIKGIKRESQSNK
ncbi:hypothetical protein [Priestia aryabhattai]